jgi:hypothetical protein
VSERVGGAPGRVAFRRAHARARVVEGVTLLPSPRHQISAPRSCAMAAGVGRCRLRATCASITLGSQKNSDGKPS